MKQNKNISNLKLIDRCPECNDKLVLIQNDRMDFKLEIIPVCNKCKKAFRDSKLGWKIIEDD